MIYMNAKNDLEPAALESFLNIATVGSSPNLDIIVALGRLPTNADCTLCKKYPWGGVRYFHVRQQMSPAANNSIKYIKDGDMGVPDTLVEFVEYARRTFPAQHYALVIWGHGYGFSLLTAMQLQSDKSQVAGAMLCGPISHTSDDACDYANEPIGGMKAVSNDVQSGHVLFNRQIEESLKKLFRNGPKLDILGFDACLMASVETAYAMRDVATYLVASEDLVPDCSWNYADSLRPLVNSRGSLTPRELAGAFVQGYRTRFARKPLYATLSAVDLSRTEDLANGISQLADALIKASDSTILSVQTSRNGCRIFGRDDGFRNPVDLEQFLHNLQASAITDAMVLQSTSHVLSIIDSRGFIVDRFPDSDDAFGLTIYFPSDVRFYTVTPDMLDHGAYERTTCDNPLKNNAVEFVCNHAWSLFLPEYYNRLNNIGKPKDN